MEVYLLEHENARKLAYQLLARGAGESWGLSKLPDIVRGPHGKPFFPSRPDLQFNLSHSGSLAVCAVDSDPVGVDIQVLRTCRPGLFDRVCCPKQREWLRARGDSPEAFALLWSMKESRCKYSGLGLQPPISQICVPLPEGGETHMVLDGLHFYLRSGPGWHMCLCSQNPWDGVIQESRIPEVLTFPAPRIVAEVHPSAV